MAHRAPKVTWSLWLMKFWWNVEVAMWWSSSMLILKYLYDSHFLRNKWREVQTKEFIAERSHDQLSRVILSKPYWRPHPLGEEDTLHNILILWYFNAKVFSIFHFLPTPIKVQNTQHNISITVQHCFCLLSHYWYAKKYTDLIQHVWTTNWKMFRKIVQPTRLRIFCTSRSGWLLLVFLFGTEEGTNN